MACCFAGGDIDPNLLDRAIRFHRPHHNAATTGPSPAAVSPLRSRFKWTDNLDQAVNCWRRCTPSTSSTATKLPSRRCCSTWASSNAGSATGGRRAAAKECHDLAVRSGQAVAELRAMTLDAMVACFRGTTDAVSISTASLAIAEAAATGRQ